MPSYTYISWNIIVFPIVPKSSYFFLKNFTSRQLVIPPPFGGRTDYSVILWIKTVLSSPLPPKQLQPQWSMLAKASEFVGLKSLLSCLPTGRSVCLKPRFSGKMGLTMLYLTELLWRWERQKSEGAVQSLEGQFSGKWSTCYVYRCMLLFLLQRGVDYHPSRALHVQYQHDDTTA